MDARHTITKTVRAIGKYISSFSYHIYTIWLFTRSDLKTIFLPSLVFAITHALAFQHASNLDSLPPYFVTQLLKSALWTWSNLLLFTVDNQPQPSSILEDRINKPWRPLASNRITQHQARSLTLTLYWLTILLSISIGGLRQCLALIALGFWHNQLGRGDKSFIIRNFLNACGFLCFNSGALEVLIPELGGTLQNVGWWLATIGGIVLTTIQTQDMYDQVGDRARGRMTMPLLLGDVQTRWITAVAMCAWSIAVPWLWRLSWLLAAPFVVVGLIVTWRTLRLRSAEQDRGTLRV